VKSTDYYAVSNNVIQQLVSTSSAKHHCALPFLWCRITKMQVFWDVEVV